MTFDRSRSVGVYMVPTVTEEHSAAPHTHRGLQDMTPRVAPVGRYAMPFKPYRYGETSKKMVSGNR